MIASVNLYDTSIVFTINPCFINSNVLKGHVFQSCANYNCSWRISWMNVWNYKVVFLVYSIEKNGCCIKSLVNNIFYMDVVNNEQKRSESCGFNNQWNGSHKLKFMIWILCCQKHVSLFNQLSFAIIRSTRSII